MGGTVLGRPVQQHDVHIQTTRVRLLGTIPGFEPHGAAVTEALDSVRPAVVALGVPPEDVEGLRQLAAEPETELPEPDDAPGRLLALLERFSTTRVPSPDLEAAFLWADGHDARLEALDLDDEAHAESYIRHNRFFDVIRGNRLQRRLLAEPFEEAKDEDELVLMFDALQNSLPSLRRVEEEREAHMAERLAEVAGGAEGEVVALVPLARLAGVVARLDQ